MLRVRLFVVPAFSAAINCKLSCLLCAYYGVLDLWGTKPLME